ncbi:hypothetical protein [Streptomyces nojiriensis]|uniref:hypothetical protein n=1 Tax=Streptomyces nojiriensis TaxID=66374 RepID=UPI001673330B|nr:hypothetical protein [Streptomyces nojiriensis]
MNDFVGTAGLITLLLVMLLNMARTGRTKGHGNTRPWARSQVPARGPLQSMLTEHAVLWRVRAKELEDLGDAVGAQKAMLEAHLSEARASRESNLGHASAVSKASLAEAAARESARKAAHEAQRRIALALLFVPAGQRERYQREWNAEMDSLNAREASAFALQLLWSAPRTGAMLWLKHTFGRRPA